jgi:hypothetical protein
MFLETRPPFQATKSVENFNFTSLRAREILAGDKKLSKNADGSPREVRQITSHHDKYVANSR